MIPVAILCGGKGSRLAPLTNTCAKSLVDVGGRPFISHQLALLKWQGYLDVVLLTGHLGEQIEAVIGDGARSGVRVRYSQETQPLGTAGAVRQALPLLGDMFFVLYGDSYLECDYARIEQCARVNQLSVSTQWGGHEYGLNLLFAADVRESHQTDLSRLTADLYAEGRLIHYWMPHRYEEMGSCEGLERVRDRLSRQVSTVH